MLIQRKESRFLRVISTCTITIYNLPSGIETEDTWHCPIQGDFPNTPSQTLALGEVVHRRNHHLRLCLVTESPSVRDLGVTIVNCILQLVYELPHLCNSCIHLVALISCVLGQSTWSRYHLSCFPRAYEASLSAFGRSLA